MPKIYIWQTISTIKQKNEIGYRLTTKSGDINYNRFINSLDYSLDRDEIISIANRAYKKT